MTKKKINLIEFIEKQNKTIFTSAFSGEELEYEKNELSELFIHKMLYFAYGYFYAKFNKELFADANFQAWKYGPVEIDVREKFKNNKKISGIKKFNIEINEKEEQFLKRIIKNLLNFSTWKIVDLSHFTAPWKNNFKADSPWEEIPNDEIKKYFIKNKYV
ncbi:MAG: SocA family protein [Malacoplasma sp.]|nr:SocA family protein [Malacoplasma sp.]